MTFRSGGDISGKRARTGGGRRGGVVAAGGGLGTVVLIGLYLLLGGSPGQLGGLLGSEEPANQAGSGPEAGSELEHCQTPEDGNKYDDCRVDFTGVSLDRVWSEVLPEQAGIDYTEPERVVFEQTTQSGCGAASAATGPFYCPADNTAYFDTSFFQQLESFGGSSAPLAQMYIVAHEFGHHIQNLEGTLGLSNYDDPGEDSNAVKIELQADCYAGIWASHADKGDDALLESITKEQVTEAIETARAVGDDNIQSRSGGQVDPDSFTHGTSEQRQESFLAGYQSGSMKSCDTLGRGAYK